VISWPANYNTTFTLQSSVKVSGVGLHTGLNSEITLSKSDQKGFHVFFRDNPENKIKLTPDLISSTKLCTALNLNGRKLYTVEHLLAALAGCGMNFIDIEVEGNEVPLLDGSSIGWVESFEKAGIEEIPNKKSILKKVDRSISLNKDSSLITLIPSEKLEIISIIDFPYGAIGQQQLDIAINPKTFVEQIAPARTFGFKDQLDQLTASGLIKGGNLNNALVCDGDSWINPPLRFVNEPVRHKILDLIGDLALIGLPSAKILVYKGSHALHADLTSALSKINF
tara:strand:- start:11349 stop:12194 length:846 start_codon:yes stop_codon:yes gene_type:complete